MRGVVESFYQRLARTLQRTPAAPRALHAAHAAGVAMTMSMPKEFKGDAAERTRRGAVAERLKAGGKVTSLEKTDEFTAAEEDALQVTVEGGAAVESTAHAPAFAAVTLVLDRQRHAGHPEMRVAECAQQQPPRHTFVPQSNADVQFSPGLESWQEPDEGAHA